MKVLILILMLLTLALLGALAEPLGMSKATALALWIALSLVIVKPLFIQAPETPH
ncbi:MAG: hypothetical protein ACN6OP_10925 [Pseudomonadales bacterium]